MRKLIFAFIVTHLLVSNTNALEQKYVNAVEPIIKVFQNNDKKSLSNLIVYPLNRIKPLPPIKNKIDFIDRFEDVFDENIIQLVSNSSIEKDWHSVGYRGIMLENGLLWLNEKGKIRALNYETIAEKKLRDIIILKQKNTLHKSIRNFKNPILEWETKKFHLRVDDMGSDDYRYTSWSINKSPSETPSLILYGGVRKFEGSGGNHSYIFTNGKHSYHCSVNVLGADDTPGSFSVYKGKKLLLSEVVIKEF